MVWSSSLGVWWGLVAHRKPACYEMLHRASDMAVSCEKGNKPSGSKKGMEIHD